MVRRIGWKRDVGWRGARRRERYGQLLGLRLRELRPTTLETQTVRLERGRHTKRHDTKAIVHARLRRDRATIEVGKHDSPRHQLLQQQFSLRLAGGHARPRRGSRGRRDLLRVHGAHWGHGLRVRGRGRDGTKKGEECVLAFGRLVCVARHVGRNRASVPGRWSRGASGVDLLLLRARIDMCARDARLRAHV